MNAADLIRRAGLPSGPAAPLSGGDVGDVWQVGDAVVKMRPGCPPDFFAAEARGLRALRAAGLRVPVVHYVDADGIVMGHLPPGPPDWRDLAEQLAALHSHRVDADYGSADDVFVGACRLPAAQSSDWQALWADARILPLVRQSGDRLDGRAPAIEAMLRRVVVPVEGPCLVHGDLWSGNVHMSTAGAAFIDPSVWVGERAVDLAMMDLFGGFPAAFWEAYEARLPIPGAVRGAVGFHQLYFILAHVVMFGRGYVAGVDRVLERYG